jgi:hypothetical protein
MAMERGAPNPAVWHPCDLDGTQQFGWDSEGGRSTWEHSEHGGQGKGGCNPPPWFDGQRLGS